MRIATWNVNGIRAAERGGFVKWFENEAADVVCLQEIKATPAQLTEELMHPLGYHSYWNPAEKAGYSGTAIYSKAEPTRVVHGMGVPEFDTEGRVLTAEFGDLAVISAYFPNSQRDHARLGYKLAFCDAMHRYLEKLRSDGRHVVLCGDLNIAHRAIDLRNPKQNEANAGFLPEERDWMERFLNSGYVDAFRHFEPGAGHYTWWSYRPGVREKNIGWRLDYHIVNREFVERMKSSVIRPEVRGSDHCPVLLDLRR